MAIETLGRTINVVPIAAGVGLSLKNVAGYGFTCTGNDTFIAKGADVTAAVAKATDVAKKNLIVFITPSIVGDNDFQADNTASDFLKTKFKGIDEEKETAWDSGKAIDWSKPVAKACR